MGVLVRNLLKKMQICNNAMFIFWHATSKSCEWAWGRDCYMCSWSVLALFPGSSHATFSMQPLWTFHKLGENLIVTDIILLFDHMHWTCTRTCMLVLLWTITWLTPLIMWLIMWYWLHFTLFVYSMCVWVFKKSDISVFINFVLPWQCVIKDIHHFQYIYVYKR